MPQLFPNEKIPCPDCSVLTTRKHMARHRKRHKNFTCSQCPRVTCSTEAELAAHTVKEHMDTADGVEADDIFKHTCSLCNSKFVTHYNLAEHKYEEHGVESHFRQSCEIEGVEKVDVIGSLQNGDDALEKELRAVKHFLQPSVTNYKHQIVFNFPLVEESHTALQTCMEKVFEELPCAAKVNLSFGYILKSNDEEDLKKPYRYFYAHDNQTLFDKAVTISDQSDLMFTLDRFEDEDFFAHIRSSRPNTKWRFHALTNVTFKATLLRNVPLGCKQTEIPDYIKKNKFIQTLTFNYMSRESYNDNLCMFRAVAYHKSELTSCKQTGIEDKALELFESFLRHFGD